MNHRTAPPASTRSWTRLAPTSDASVSRSASQTAATLAPANPPANTARRAKIACSSSGEQPVAPVDRRAQRALTRRQVARPLARELERARHRFEQLARGVVARPRRRELDRERQTVEAPAEPSHLVGLLAGPAKARRDRASPRDEEPDGVRQRQRLDPVLMLAGEPERRSARGEHDQPGRRAQQLAHERSRGVDDLEVVEEQQGLSPAEERLQRRLRWLVPLRRRARARPAIASGTSSGSVRCERSTK